MGTYLRSRPSACVPALVPASHQLLMPAANVDGISLAGGNALSEGVREGAIKWAHQEDCIFLFYRFNRPYSRKSQK